MKTTETRPIVCGTDFSENADATAVVADALARRIGAPLILAHSVDERGEFPENLRTRLMNEDRPQLAEQARRLRSRGLTFEEKLMRGVPDEGITDFAAQSGARLVVVGASGMGSAWVGRMVLGNIAERIAESSPVPTLVVRDGAPLEAWARGERTLKVFVGVDFSASSDAALRWVAELRQTGPCEVVAGYVDWPPEESARLGITAPVGLGENPPEIQRMLERDLRGRIISLLGEKDVRIHVRIHVRGNAGRADAPLIEMAVEARADLIVVGTHQRHGLSRLRHGSVSRGILHHAPMSVVCVPASATVAGIPEIRRVLVATDLSEHGGHAIPYAYSTLPRDGVVCLLHVVKPGDAERAEEAEARLRALVPDGAGAHGVATDVRVVERADAARAICEAAERFGADLVCIGSHGRSGLTATVMGSVAMAVIAQCRRPVLFVRPPRV